MTCGTSIHVAAVDQRDRAVVRLALQEADRDHDGGDRGDGADHCEQKPRLQRERTIGFWFAVERHRPRLYLASGKIGLRQSAASFAVEKIYMGLASPCAKALNAARSGSGGGGAGCSSRGSGSRRPMAPVFI
jgi:hypothetical protein